MSASRAGEALVQPSPPPPPPPPPLLLAVFSWRPRSQSNFDSQLAGKSASSQAARARSWPRRLFSLGADLELSWRNRSGAAFLAPAKESGCSIEVSLTCARREFAAADIFELRRSALIGLDGCARSESYLVAARSGQLATFGPLDDRDNQFIASVGRVV